MLFSMPYIGLSVLENGDIPQFLVEDGINQIFLNNDPLPYYSEIQRALKDLGHAG